MPRPDAPVTETLTTPDGVTLGYDRQGAGPPLVLLHGSFSDHRSNWAETRPLLARHLTVHALARRGRGDTDATYTHGIEDEARDVLALIDRIGVPVHLLGHSHGAQVALAAAAMAPDRIRRLVLYEPPHPDGPKRVLDAELKEAARQEDWTSVARAFFTSLLDMPGETFEGLRLSKDWEPMLADARASIGDMQAMARMEWRPERFAGLSMPVLLQSGSESPARMFVTDDLARVLPDARRDTLEGQGHDATLTAPEAYAASVLRFLLDGPKERPR
ncbi:alpha/beta fold hydrolase [Limimaricola pyoseonensis]|uniref:Pimeloyl-ACP methyl ester carboxylesterase n=1 Tax=Limimaricola pyoseonensis TaxID=521013 RepID=A0A1G7FXM2_9RHOB|nr:alpha/beta hydrolase [Limimaricola pyoseonensis]SDE80495.1 Pimeloyl-ACP methyl ester carboxylesterase [Limimaricola pyoseonensis]